MGHRLDVTEARRVKLGVAPALLVGCIQHRLDEGSATAAGDEDAPARGEALGSLIAQYSSLTGVT